MTNSEYAGKKGLYSLEFKEAGGQVRAQAAGPFVVGAGALVIGLRERLPASSRRR